MAAARLPEFVIIGAAKSATTWLSENLRERPEVFMPGPEPHFFSTQFDKGLAWYGEWFRDAAAETKVGEKSADYLAHPPAAERLRRVLPDARLIVQLRNPVERAYSDYCMLFRRGEVSPAIERHLDPRRAAGGRFLEGGLYGRHLARYCNLFPREQIKVLLHDDIRRAPGEAWDEVCGFVGLAPGRPPTISRGVKVKDAPMLPTPMRRLLRPLRTAAQRWRSRPWFRAVHASLARPVAYPPLPPGLRARLQEHYAEDIDELQRLLGRNLQSWLTASSLPLR